MSLPGYFLWLFTLFCGYPSQEVIFGPPNNRPIKGRSPQPGMNGRLAPLKTEDDRINSWQCSCVSMVNHFVVGGNSAWTKLWSFSVGSTGMNMKTFFSYKEFKGCYCRWLCFFEIMCARCKWCWHSSWPPSWRQRQGEEIAADYQKYRCLLTCVYMYYMYYMYCMY